MTGQRDRMRVALTPPTHGVSCRCPVCAAFADSDVPRPQFLPAIPALVCRECGCSYRAPCRTVDGFCTWESTYDDATGLCTGCAPAAAYAELDLAGLLTWRSLYLDQCVEHASQCVLNLFADAGLIPRPLASLDLAGLGFPSPSVPPLGVFARTPSPATLFTSG